MLTLLIVSQATSEEAPTPTAEDVYDYVYESLTTDHAAANPTKAPPLFVWPTGLPAPYTRPDGSETCFPHPTDTALNLYMAYHEAYPGMCQERIDLAWHALEEYEAAVNAELGDAPPAIVDGWPGWMVGLVVGGAAVIALSLGLGGGYILGVSQ